MSGKFLYGALLICILLAFVSIRWRDEIAHAKDQNVAEAPIAGVTEVAANPFAPMERDLSSGRAQAAESLADGIALLPGTREMFSRFQNPDESAEYDLELIDESVSQYRRIFGTNPTGGLNAEIVDAMLGRNPKRIAVLPRELLSLNSDGELLDRWGTAYYFHPVSGVVMEVMSSGPDQVLWTADDVGVFHPANSREDDNAKGE